MKEQYASSHGAGSFKKLARLVDAGMEAVSGINFIDGNVIFHTFPLDPSLKWLKAGGIFALFHPDTPLANQSGIWSILAARRTPPSRDDIVTEKERARRLSEEMCQTIASFAGHLPPDLTERLAREWGNAKALAELYTILCRAICAYFDGIESGDRTGFKFDSVLTEAHPCFTAWLTDAELARTLVSQKDAVAYHGIYEMRGNEFKSIYARPLWAILHELRREYDVETAMRSRWATEKSVVDLIVFGAVTDEWRISRYMHASHARCADGYLSRQVGNSVFPNGFLEFEMARPETGGKLILEGRPEMAGALVVMLDGGEEKQVCLSNARISIDLPKGGGEIVRVRLQKDGPLYPEVCIAAVVR